MDLDACRLCGKNRGYLYLFEPTSSVLEKLRYFCVNIEISIVDGLPAYICNDCERDVTICYQFVKQCELCDEQYRQYKHNIHFGEKQQNDDLNLESHAVYVKEENYHCNSECDSIPAQESDAQNKIERHKVRKNKKVNKFQCDFCNGEFKYKSVLNTHIISHHIVKDVLCDVCDKTYKSRNALNRHIERHHKENRTKDFVCEVCAKAFYTKNDIKIHLRIHTGETPYSCTICNKHFKQVGALRRHERSHSSNKPYTCETCSKQFRSKFEWKTHQNVHSAEKNHACNICNKLFKFKNNVLKHMKLHISDEKHFCQLCTRAFRSKYSLKKHTNKLHSSKSGSCNVCMKDVPDLETHLRNHEGERPYKCDYCPSTFSKKNALTYHTSYRHLNQDKYKCTVEGCHKSFPAQPMLEYHTAKAHGTVMPFLCDICCRGFYRKSDLARHKIGTHKDYNHT